MHNFIAATISKRGDRTAKMRIPSKFGFKYCSRKIFYKKLIKNVFQLVTVSEIHTKTANPQ